LSSGVLCQGYVMASCQVMFFVYSITEVETMVFS